MSLIQTITAINKGRSVRNSAILTPEYNYEWEQVLATGLPSVRDGAFGFSIGSKHYIALGWTNGGQRYKDFFESTNLTGDVWNQLSDVPNTTPRHTVAEFRLPNAAYFVGADVQAIQVEGSYQSDSHKFNGTSWNRQAIDANTGQRSLMGSAYHNGSFYLIGGQSRYDYNLGNFSNVLRSNNDAVSFSAISNHPFDGGNLWGSLVSFNGKLWKIGGGQYWDSILSNRTYPVDIYSSADGLNWSLEAYFPSYGRQYHQAIVFDNKIWLIGGYNNNEGGNLQDVWSSADGVNWVQQSTPPWSARHAMSCWVANGELWMFGGSQGPGGGATSNQLWKMKRV